MAEELSFGQWLKRRRKIRDFTQVALARAVPCAVQTIRALESDALRPSRELAVRLAQALGMPLPEHESFVAFARGREAPADWDTLSPAAMDASIPVPHDHTHDAAPSAVPPPDAQADRALPSAVPLPRPSG